MKKHLSMLMLLAALIVPWASRAQSHTLGEYAFSTGVDATKWVSMTGATQILSPSASDGLASSVQNIGFSFPFGATNYTQYSVNTDGNLRLGATATGTGTYTTPFSSANCATNSPKINAFGCDGYGVSGSHYVKAKQHVNNDGDTLLAVEFCMGTFTSTTRDFLYKWQVHLYKNGNIEIVFPAASGIPATAPAVTHQCGMCVNASDGWIISSATNTAQHFTNGSSVTNAANTWFDANRYYSFTHPNQISCPAPRALTLTNVTTDSATFTWIPGRYETEWAYSLNGGDWVTTSDSTVTFDTLVANTPYVFEVRAVCGFDDTSASSTMTFRTECAMLSSLPYEEGFEESPAYSAVPYADAFPNCWIRINDASNTSYNYYPYITTTASYVHSGSNGMYWYHTTTNTYASNMYAVLPQVDLNVYDISDLTLAFYCKTTGTSYHPQPIVGVMTDPNNASTFTPVYTFTATEVTTSWQLFHVSLASYTGTGSYVAIKWPRPSAASYMAIDDIFLTDTWCNVPQNVLASSTQTDVTLSWGANGVSSFTVVFSGDTISNINDSTYTVTGLTPDSTYSYAVFPECGNVLGMPVRGTIHTKCLALTAADLPYSEDFEAYGSGSAYPINSCWAKGLVTLFGTGNTTNYPYPSSTAITGTRSLYFYTSTSSSTSYYNWLALPGIDATELSMSDLMLTFKMKRPSTSSYSSILVVGVTTDYSTTAGFVPVDTIDISSLAINTVSDIEVNFANYTGTGTYVLLYAPAPTMTGTSAVYNTFYIDDVVLRVTPTCYWPASVSLSNLSSDEATISWVPDSRTANPSGWIVEYDTTGFTLGEGMTMNVNDTSVTLTGLDPMTQYDVYIRANCGNGDVSDPTNVLTFRTECGPLTELPYTENFDSVVGSTSTTPTSNILPPCWSYFNHGTRTNYMYCPYVYSSATYAHSGTNSIRFYSYNSSADSNQYLILPLVDPNSYAVSDLQVSFWLRGNSTSSNYYNKVVVGVMSDPLDESTFVPVDTVGTTSTTTYEYFTVNFDQYTGNVGRITLMFPKPLASSQYEYGYVDDVTIREIPNCLWPASVELDSVTSDEAIVSWSPDVHTPNPSNWIVEYGEHGFTLGEGTTLTEYDTTATLTGLLPNTQYDVYVSANCGSEVSEASPVLTFRTNCGALTTLPFTENFDGVTGATTTSVAVNNLPPCWNHYNVGTSTSYSGYPIVYNSATYAHSGSQAMRFYTYITAGTYADQIAIMPLTDSTLYPISNLQLDFWMRSNSTSYNSWVVVGVMTNPTDASTFIPVETVYTNSSTTYAYHEVSFATYTGPHGYVTFKFPQPTTGYNYGYVDDITLETLPTCPGITNLEANTTVGAALLTWGYQNGFNEPDGYIVTYDSIGGTNPTTLNPTTSNVMLTGLEASTSYKVYVQADCGGDGLGRLDSITFSTGTFGCAVPDPASTSIISIGSGTTTTYYVPIGNFYNYSYVQQLITADELNGPTTISAIEFQYAYSTATTVKNNVTIYLANVSATSLESAFVPYNASTFVQVYTGNMNCTNGWNTFNFTTPFSYDGTSNLLIVVHDNSGAYPGSSYTYYGHSATGKARYIQNDSSPYSISSPGTGTSYSTRANMKIHTFGCLTPATCAAPAVSVTNVGTDSVTLAWVPGFNETSWDVAYRIKGTTAWINYISGTTATSATIDNLIPGTDYQFRVSFECNDANNTLYAATAEARTQCAFVDLPYSYGFEDQPTGSTTVDPDITCWHHLNNGTTYHGYPYVTSTAHNSTRSLYWYASTTATTYGDYQMVVLPRVDTTVHPANTLQLNFWARPSSTSYSPIFIVGVMTDPENANSFVPVDTVYVSNASVDWVLYEVPLNNYTGHGEYVALRANRPGSVWYAYTDDFTLDVIPTCPHVRNLVADNATENSITLSWVPGSDETAWSITDGVNYYTSTDTTTIITGLYPNTAYTFEVRALCDATDSSYAMSIQARTACPQYMTLPYLEDFEGYGSGTTVFPDCWYKLGSTADRPYIHATTSYGHNNSHGLYFYAAASGYCYAILPPVDINTQDITNLQVGFWARQYSTSYNSDFEIGVMTDPTDTSTFTVIGSAHPAGTSYEYFEVSLSSYTDTGSYIAFRSIQHAGSTTAIYMMLDDLEVWHNSSCPSAEGLYASTVSNNFATVEWTVDTTTAGYTGVMLYIANVNNIAAATDSVLVTSGTSHTFTGLHGTTTYYVWAVTQCTAEPARARSTSFTTTEDCMPVTNVVVAGVDHTAFGLSWDAPTVGNPVTGYRVMWKAATATTWDTIVVTTPYCYISGLTTGTVYNYRVTTLCDTLASATNSGNVSTLPCGEMITEGGAENNLLPMYYYWNYSYTQQIYLASELGDIDSISAITYYYTGNITTPRTVAIYMANTAKDYFEADTDYVAASELTQVYNGTMSGTGWITLTLNTPFLRSTDSNLVIAFVDNTGSYVESTNWGATATSEARAIYYYWDDEPILPSAPTADNHGVLNYVNQIILTAPGCTLPACATPIIFADSISSNSISFLWNTEAGRTYDVSYRAHGDENWITVATGDTTGTCTITGLEPSAEWDVRVSTLCGDVTLTGNATLQTLCGPVALPLTEDFENCDFGLYSRYCWTMGSTNLGTTYPLPRITRLQGSEDKICMLYNGAYMILPEVAEDLDSLQIRFKLTQGGTNVRFIMGLVLDPDAPISAIYPLDTLIRSEIDPSVSEVNITYQFAGNVPAGYHHAHIAFWDAFNDNYSFLNDMVVEYVPQCTPATEFSVDTTTTTSATISWANDGLNATSYIIEYGPRYYTPGTGTILTATSSPVTINGLTHSTSYDAYVYTVCSVNGDTSIAGQVVRFETACDVVTTLPYTMDFENIMSPGSSATDVIPNCWGSEGSTMPHIMYSSTAAYYGSASHCFYFSAPAYAALPQLSAPLNTLKMTFRAYNATPTTSKLIIGTVDNTGAGFSNSFVPYDTVDFVNGSNNVYNVTCYLNDYTGTANHIAIHSTGSSAIYIDDIVIDTLPGCIAPQHVHVDYVIGNEARIVWNRSTSTNYTIIYGVHNSATTTTVTTNTRDILLTGLTPLTQYDVLLADDCSNDTIALTFTTPCNAVPLPYTENFDNITTSTTASDNYGLMPNCWDYTLTNASYSTSSYLPGVYYGATNANSGSYSMRFAGVGYFALPPMPTRLDSLQIVFNRYYASTGYGLEVGVMEGTTFVPVQTINTPVSTHTEVTVPLNTYHGGSRIIAFRNTYSSNTYSYNYIDDIEVDYIPTCPKVTGLTYTGITDNTVDLQWNSGSTETEWLVTYNGNDTIVNDTVPTITGLAPNTDYTISVRPVCDVDDTGRARTITVHTMCLPVSLPYQENFDNVTTSTSTTNYGLVPSCWNYTMTGTASYQTGSYLPRVYYSSTYANSGNYSYYMYGVGYHMLPPMPTSLDSLELTFSRYFTSTSYGLEVGVMEGNTFVPVETIINGSTSTHTDHTVYFGTYTGTSRIIAFRNYYTTSATTYYSGNYIDDIDVHYLPTCPRVLDVHAAGASTTSIDVDWVDQVQPLRWQIEYGPVGHTLGSAAGTTISVYSHPHTITGLDTLTGYDFYVRPICAVGDTGAWSNKATLSTELCDDVFAATTGTLATGTANQIPVDNFYKYTLSQTIIDSAELAGISEIIAIAYSYNYATASTKKTDVDIWLQPTNKTTFSGTTDVVALNPSTAVKVYHGNLNCSQGWNYFQFDTTYTWDGHSNLLVIVDDNSNQYDGSAYVFNTSTCTGSKTLVYYSDSENPNVNSPSSFSGSKYVYSYRPTMKLISCGGCATPTVLSITKDYHAATITVGSAGENYELEYGTDPSNLNHNLMSATGTFNLTGLVPSTNYFFHVRQYCDSSNVSDWLDSLVTTDELPCFAVTNLQVAGTGYTSVDLTWTAGGNETAWEVKVYNNIDTFSMTTALASATVTGLMAQTGYYANVRPLCGSGADVEGPWCDSAIYFTTDYCHPVENVTVTAGITTATVAWTAPTGATNFRVAYGPEGFPVGGETGIYNVTSNPFELTDLEPETPYTVQVANVCNEDLVSAWARADFVTLQEEGIVDIDAEGNISLFPNPASTTVTIGLAEVSDLTIVDLNGREVFRANAVSSATIDVSTYAKGAYFVRVVSESGTSVRKLVVK